VNHGRKPAPRSSLTMMLLCRPEFSHPGPTKMDLQDVLARQESPFPSCLIADQRDCFLLVLVLVPVIVIVLDDGNHL